MNQAERVERIFLWGPEGMQPPSAAPPVTWLPLHAGGAGGGAFGVQMFRLDVARPVPFTDLAVFEPVAEHGMTVPAPEHGDVW